MPEKLRTHARFKLRNGLLTLTGKMAALLQQKKANRLKLQSYPTIYRGLSCGKGRKISINTRQA